MCVVTVSRWNFTSGNIYKKALGIFWFQVQDFNISGIFFFYKIQLLKRWKMKAVVPFLPRYLILHSPCSPFKNKQWKLHKYLFPSWFNNCLFYIHHMGDFTQGKEWLLKNFAIFFYGEIDISLHIGIDGLQLTCTYQLRVKSGPQDFSLRLALVELA